MSHAKLRRRLALQLSRWVVALCLSVAGTGFGQDQAYVVKHSDTLFGIARQFGISPGQLADRNGISRNAQVYVGQNLIIPIKAAPAAATIGKLPPSPLVATVQHAI